MRELVRRWTLFDWSRVFLRSTGEDNQPASCLCASRTDKRHPQLDCVRMNAGPMVDRLRVMSFLWEDDTVSATAALERDRRHGMTSRTRPGVSLVQSAYRVVG